MTTIIFNACPQCGCFDIRATYFGYQCFKCGYEEKVENKNIMWSGKEVANEFSM